MGGVQLGDGMVLGNLVVPNLWGAEVVHGLFIGGRASDRLVPNLPPTHPNPKEHTPTAHSRSI